MNEVLRATGLAKTFTLHARGGAQLLPVFAGVDLAIAPGECVALTGRSGSGKSSLLRCLYGNYAPTAGDVRVHHEGKWVSIAASALCLARIASATFGSPWPVLSRLSLPAALL